MPVARPRDEIALVERARDGDVAAFEALVRAYADAVYGHALRFFGEPATAEDAAQEVFVKVYRGLGSFDGRSAFSTWLYRVTRNVCLDQYRRGRGRPVPYDPADLPERATADHADAATLSAALESAVVALPPEERDAFNAVALFGMSYEEAAVTLEAPVGTVKSRVFRARRTLIALLSLGESGS
jgi:RNA polymerase sigma-70 factor (ECF subfamily)